MTETQRYDASALVAHLGLELQRVGFRCAQEGLDIVEVQRIVAAHIFRGYQDRPAIPERGHLDPPVSFDDLSPVIEPGASPAMKPSRPLP